MSATVIYLSVHPDFQLITLSKYCPVLQCALVLEIVNGQISDEVMALAYVQKLVLASVGRASKSGEQKLDFICLLKK